MKDIDLNGKHFMTFGKKNTGKSYFNNWLMSRTSGNYAIFDPLHEHTDYGDDDLCFRPTSTRGEEAHEQLGDFLTYVVENRDHYDFVWIDEINRFHGKGGTLDGPIGDVTDFNAHYGMGVGGIARRPVQVHTDLRDLADFTFVFRLNGVSDVRTLDDMARGLGERAASLDQREFIILFPDGSYRKADPIKDKVRHDKGY